MVDFATGKEKRLAEVVAAVRKPYADKPVGSPAIGAVVGMSHHQALVYLHEREQVRAAAFRSIVQQIAASKKPDVDGTAAVLREAG